MSSINQRAIIITQNSEAKVIIQDIKSYENLHHSLNILKLIIQSENDIDNDNVIKQEELFNDLEDILFQRLMQDK